MIIFNDRELKSPYTLQESNVIEINSYKTIDEIIDMLLNDQPIDEEISITCNKFSDMPIKMQDNNDPIGVLDLYNYTFLDEDFLEFYDEAYQRPPEFAAFEAYTFGQQTIFNFHKEDISKEDLLFELKAAIGVLPTLMDKNLTVKELREYSSLGRQLFAGNLPISQGNPCPNIEDIDRYKTYNDYEKRLITKKQIHPYKAFQYAEALKNKISPKYIFSMDDYIDVKGSTPKLDIEETIDFLLFKDRMMPQEEQDRIKAKFEEIHRFSPRVANEYIYGKKYLHFADLSEKNLEDWVKSFQRSSVQKIAATKSPMLLAVSDILNYGQIPTQLIDALAVYLQKSNINYLYEKGFFEWLNQYKGEKVSDIVELIKKVNDVEKYDKPPKDLLSYLHNKRGYEDSKKFEGAYQGYKFEKNELAIKGRNIVAKEGSIVMRILPADDYANFTVGYDTNCCQHYGNAGESCVKKATSDPFAGTLVIEMNGVVKAQAFIWTEEKTSTLVFDNMEFAGQNDNMDNYFSNRFRDIIAEWAKVMPYQNIHIGTGYNQSMRGFGKPIKYTAIPPTTLENEYLYTDYNSRARSIKKDGEMELTRLTNANIEVIVEPDEPTRWDNLATPELSFLLNKHNMSVDERLETAQLFKDNPEDESLQKLIVEENPSAITSIENPTRETQEYILRHFPEYIKDIKNPIEEIKLELVRDNPLKILEYENPSDELKQVAISQNGLLIKDLTFEDESYYEYALRQNGLAIEYVPEEKQTERLQRIAVNQNEKAILLIKEPKDSVIRECIEKNPTIVAQLDNLTQEQKILAIQTEPSTILSIKTQIGIDESIEEYEQKIGQMWRTAVERNGLLIRHCGKTYPELREIAITNNPYVIRCFPDPTDTEIDIAIGLNPKIYQIIRTPEGKSYAYQKAIELYGEENVPKKNIYQPKETTRINEEEQIDLI